MLHKIIILKFSKNGEQRILFVKDSFNRDFFYINSLSCYFYTLFNLMTIKSHLKERKLHS